MHQFTNKISLHTLRIGVAITFLWIGVLIFKDPEGWGGFLRPWAVNFLPVPIKQAMFGTAALDVTLGLLMLINRYVWLAALVGSAHLAGVLIVSGIDAVTVRDIGLLAATAALCLETLPNNVRSRLTKLLSNNKTYE